MDIRKNGNFSLMRWLVLIGTSVLIAQSVSLANNTVATEVLIATYKSPPVITPAEAQSAIARLQKALADCQDSYLAFRIRYRIGATYFKAGVMGQAKTEFSRVANDAKCPETVRMCSLNMIGQISRLTGKNEQALKAFNQMVSLLEQQLTVSQKNQTTPVLMKLLSSALLSRAEIYQLQRNYAASITQYNRLLSALKQSADNVIFSQYAALVNDRISQLYLQQGDVVRYIKLAQALTADYPRYYRTPLVKFEIECVKFLEAAAPDLEFVNGSFVAPVLTTAYLKDSKGTNRVQRITSKLNELCKEYSTDSYGGILLRYYYAWLLDTLGEKDKATGMLAQISSADIDSIVRQKTIAKAIQGYAKIQQAIMLAEKTDYTQALRVLGSLRTHPDESHISKLAKSVSESVQILKREVPKK